MYSTLDITNLYNSFLDKGAREGDVSMQSINRGIFNKDVSCLCLFYICHYLLLDEEYIDTLKFYIDRCTKNKYISDAISFEDIFLLDEENSVFISEKSQQFVLE